MKSNIKIVKSIFKEFRRVTAEILRGSLAEVRKKL
tara:strand:- start:1539 stop:1643 length:105 start_codon:yes stop_codon:yes gene_type:complete